MGVVTVLIIIPLRRQHPEYAMLAGLCCCLIIFGLALQEIAVIVAFVEQLLESLPLNSSYVAMLFKMLGVAYVAEFSSSLCKDAGYSSIAGQIEMFGKLFILALSIPGLAYLLDLLEQFI